MKTKPLVLIVDDDDNFLEILSLQLQVSGSKTSILKSSDEKEVVARCEKLKPDLVLLDIFEFQKPVGFQIAQALKRNKSTKDIKIAFWSAAGRHWTDVVSDQTIEMKSFIKRIPFFDKGEDVAVMTQKIIKLLA